MDVINEENCRIILNNGKFTSKIISFTLSPYSESTIGFLGQHYRLTIKVSDSDSESNEYKILHFFVKTPPQNVSTFSEYVSEIGAFTREMVMLKNILPKMRQYESKKWAPVCLFANEKAIVLEDLAKENYMVRPVREYFDYEHMACTIKTLARFHSSSIICEEMSTEDLFKSHREALKELCYVFENGHSRNKWMESSIHCTLTLLKMLPNYKKEYELKLRAAVNRMEQLVRISPQYRMTVSHGDLWCNNIMFSYDAKGKLQNCVFVDFQLTRYCCPAYDVLSCIYLTTNSTFRNKYLDHLLKIYHEKMTDELSKYGIDINTTLPWNEWMETCKIYKHAACLDAVFFGQMVFLKEEATKLILESSKEFYEYTYLKKRSVYAKTAFLEDCIYKERMTDILNEIVYILENDV